MSLTASLMLTLATAVAPMALADFDTLSPLRPIHDTLPVRFTEDRAKPRHSRYLWPSVDTLDDGTKPARVRIRGRKVKLRVPLGTGG